MAEKMIWLIDNIDRKFTQDFIDAGPVDYVIVDSFLKRTGRQPRAQNNPEVKRFYYLYQYDPRVRLTLVGSPLPEWEGKPAMIILGTEIILGEFVGNKTLVGKKGINLKVQPASWLKGDPDQRFALGSEALDAISFQVIDGENRAARM